ncbi:MAG: G8 domain-containing protein [Pseudomonadota bacterium]
MSLLAPVTNIFQPSFFSTASFFDFGNFSFVRAGVNEKKSKKPAKDKDEKSPRKDVPAADDGDDLAEGAGLLADYFILESSVSALSQIDFDAAPDSTGTVDALNMTRSDNPFWKGGPTNNFAARYSGELSVEKAGAYTFYLTSDDGSALYIDGVRVIDNDNPHGDVLEVVELNLEPGDHSIEVRYFENGGEQTLELDWSGPDTDGARATIDARNLTQAPPEPITDDNVDTVDEDTATDTGDSGSDSDGMTDHDDGMVHDDGVTDDDGTDASDGDDTQDGDHVHDDTDATNDDSVYDQPMTAEEEDAFVAAVKSEPDHAGHTAHADDEMKATEHGQLLDLVPRSEATHVAVRDGDWFDPDTWHEGRIPDAGAKVLVPKGVSVRYDGESDESLFTVRVDGELSFATDTDTRMLLDTMVVSSSGVLEIGTEDNPVQGDVKAEIIIANNGDIDVGWDPALLSRGIISHGQAEIHGAAKTAYTKVSDAPMAGDTEIRLAETPDNWSVGDTIVLTGTHKTGWTWNGQEREHIESQDEEVVITAINGSTVSIDRALQYDHDAPRDDLSAYVANMSRNITFSSEDGEATEVHHRGHVMFMHNDDVDVRYAAFDDLGRTDKSEPAFQVESLDSVQADSNVQGRYSFHFHRTGTEDQDNPAIAFGNAVSGSPGWGFVHHSSHAEFVQNTAFDVFGAAFVAEDGDETGLWWENMAIRTEGIGFGDAKTKSGDDVHRDDIGRTGDGFFFGGRAVEAGHNIAANTTHGYVWMLRASDANPTAEQLDHPDAYYGREPKGNDQIPIQGFHDNEAFGTQVGMIVVKSSTWQGHEVRTVMDGFTNWETSEGVNLTYTSHYTLKDFDLIGTTNTDKISSAGTGFKFGGLTFDLVLNGFKAEGFELGIELDQRAGDTWTDADYGHVIIDAEFANNVVDVNGFNPDRHMWLTSDDLVEGRLSFDMQGSTSLEVVAGEGLYLDGIKTDSIGSRDRQFVNDEQKIWLTPMLKKDGYYETESGDYVMLVKDYVADRATGDLLKLTHVVTIETSRERLDIIGAVNNGFIDLDSQAPVTQDDHFTTTMGSSILIDPMANDFDPEGAALEIDGFTNPFHANLTLQDDGMLLYEPHENKVGSESFDYWVADDNGVLSKGTVFVDIFDI